MQAEAGGLAKHELGVDVELAGGELDAVAEGLAEVFFAVEGQDVEGASTSRTQSVWRLWSKKVRGALDKIRPPWAVEADGEASLPPSLERREAFKKLTMVDIGRF